MMFHISWFLGMDVYMDCEQRQGVPTITVKYEEDGLICNVDVKNMKVTKGNFVEGEVMDAMMEWIEAHQLELMDMWKTEPHTIDSSRW